MIRYSILRFLIFFGVVFVLWLVGLRDNPTLLLVLSAVISVVVSFVALRGMREEMTRQLQERFEAKAEARAQEAAATGHARPASADELAEDAEVDGGEGSESRG